MSNTSDNTYVGTISITDDSSGGDWGHMTVTMPPQEAQPLDEDPAAPYPDGAWVAGGGEVWVNGGKMVLGIDPTFLKEVDEPFMDADDFLAFKDEL